MRFDRGIAGIGLWLIATMLQPTFAENGNLPLRGQQRQLPNDVEQKASYCLAVIKLQYSDSVLTANANESNANKSEDKSVSDPDLRKLLEESAQIDRETTQLFREVAKKEADNINRLQLFLLPRIPYLVPTAMLAAYTRGEKDYYKQRGSKKSTQCLDRCKNNRATKEGACTMACMEEDDLNRRIFQCRDLSFLPY